MDEGHALDTPKARDASERLRTVRDVHGLTQHDVAELLETTQQSVHRWEHGRLPVGRMRQRLLVFLDEAEGPTPRFSSIGSNVRPLNPPTTPVGSSLAAERTALARAIVLRLEDPRGVAPTDLEAIFVAARLLGMESD